MKFKTYLMLIALCMCSLFISITAIIYCILLEEPERVVVNITKYKIREEEEVKKEDYIDNKSQIEEQIKQLSYISDKKDWFIEYKKIVENHKEEIGFVSIYELFTDDEIYLMQKTIETECYDADFESKVNVASVIFNRIKSGEYGDLVEEIIKSPNQFTYYREEISSDTVLALEYAYMIGDTTNGCIAFRSGELPYVWGDWTLQFVDDIGHGFYS